MGADVAGPLDGIPYLTALLDRTQSTALRHVLLRFLEATVAPSAARASDAAAQAARANADSLVDCGGVQLAIDIVAGQPLFLIIFLPSFASFGHVITSFSLPAPHHVVQSSSTFQLVNLRPHCFSIYALWFIASAPGRQTFVEKPRGWIWRFVC